MHTVQFSSLVQSNSRWYLWLRKSPCIYKSALFLSLTSFPNVVFETVLMFVPVTDDGPSCLVLSRNIVEGFLLFAPRLWTRVGWFRSVDTTKRYCSQLHRTPVTWRIVHDLQFTMPSTAYRNSAQANVKGSGYCVLRFKGQPVRTVAGFPADRFLMNNLLCREIRLNDTIRSANRASMT